MNDYYKVDTMSSTTENQYTFDYYSHDGQFNDDLLTDFEVSSETYLKEPYTVSGGGHMIAYQEYTSKLLFIHFGDCKIGREQAILMYGKNAITSAEGVVDRIMNEEQ